MAHPRSCSKHACIHVHPPCLQTAVILLASFILLAVAVAAEAPLPGVHRFDDLTDARGATTSAAAPTSNGGGASPAMTQRVPLHFSLGSREYLMEVFVHGQKFRAVADTGSSLTWLRPPPQQMSSEMLDCNKCTRSSSCKCEGKQCSFDIHYGGGSQRRGFMFTEKLSFHSEKDNADDNKKLAIGWSEDTNMYDGVVGLGRGEQSLVKQLGHHTLSYCLATHTDDGGGQKSKLIVGGAHSTDAALLALLKESACTKPSGSEGHGICKVHTTSLLLRSSPEEFYYVHLKSIKMGANTINLPKVNADKSSESTANMFIDSGSPFTILEKSAYEEVVKHVGNAMPEGALEVPYSNTVCWSDTHPEKLGALEPDPKKLGELELHFARGRDEKDDAVIYLKKDQILYDDGLDEKGRKSVCLGFKKKPTRPSVLGNLQQQNLLMHFDISENKLSFVRVDDCAKVNI